VASSPKDCVAVGQKCLKMGVGTTAVLLVFGRGVRSSTREIARPRRRLLF
jgi:hypothetical protein